MAYQIYIQRDAGTPITFSEWQNAIQLLEGVRSAEKDDSVTNPKTGEVIAITSLSGVAEVFSPDQSK